MATIKISISPSGETKIETEGFVGSSCKDATAAIEAALQGSNSPTAKVEFKPDYYASNTTSDTTNIGW